MSKTILFVHGAWVTPHCWASFKGYFETRGYRCVAPAWPTMDRPVEDLRAYPDPALAKLGIKDLVEHYEAKILALSEPPILIGHSFGGLIVQMLLDRGLGSAGVAIDPAPPFGILPTPRALKSALPVLLSFNGWNRLLTMSFKSFSRTFANDLPQAQRRATYNAHIVPAPGRLFFQAAFGRGNAVAFANPRRAPLLLIAGEDDATVPPSMVRANFKKQQRGGRLTEFALFSGHSHWLIAEPGWEDVAERAQEWLQRSGL
jgi:pimeloyl-ACP methyl ester carboxylesterase